MPLQWSNDATADRTVEPVPIDIIGDVRELYRSPEHSGWHGHFEVSVAICFASNRDTLGETIESLVAQQGGVDFELLLVSNATNDDSVDVARTAAQGLPVRILECESVGYDSNARNVCMTEAAADKLLFLDSDDTVSPSYVADMSAALDASALVTGVWSLHRHNAEHFPQVLDRPHTSPKGWPFRHQGWTFAPGGTLGMRKQVPAAIGGFDPELLYGANNEWCFRAYAAGFEIVAVPTAVVHYRLRPSIRQALRQRYLWGISEVAAARAAERYGMPRRRGVRALGGGRYYRLGRRVLSVRSRYDVYDVVSGAGQAAGHVTGSARYRRLDL